MVCRVLLPQMAHSELLPRLPAWAPAPHLHLLPSASPLGATVAAELRVTRPAPPAHPPARAAAAAAGGGGGGGPHATSTNDHNNAREGTANRRLSDNGDDNNGRAAAAAIVAAAAPPAAAAAVAGNAGASRGGSASRDAEQQQQQQQQQQPQSAERASTSRTSASGGGEAPAEQQPPAAGSAAALPPSRPAPAPTAAATGRVAGGGAGLAGAAGLPLGLTLRAASVEVSAALMQGSAQQLVAVSTFPRSPLELGRQLWAARSAAVAELFGGVGAAQAASAQQLAAAVARVMALATGAAAAPLGGGKGAAAAEGDGQDRMARTSSSAGDAAGAPGRAEGGREGERGGGVDEEGRRRLAQLAAALPLLALCNPTGVMRLVGRRVADVAAAAPPSIQAGGEGGGAAAEEEGGGGGAAAAPPEFWMGVLRMLCLSPEQLHLLAALHSMLQPWLMAQQVAYQQWAGCLRRLMRLETSRKAQASRCGVARAVCAARQRLSRGWTSGASRRMCRSAHLAVGSRPVPLPRRPALLCCQQDAPLTGAACRRLASVRLTLPASCGLRVPCMAGAGCSWAARCCARASCCSRATRSWRPTSASWRSPPSWWWPRCSPTCRWVVGGWGAPAACTAARAFRRRSRLLSRPCGPSACLRRCAVALLRPLATVLRAGSRASVACRAVAASKPACAGAPA